VGYQLIASTPSGPMAAEAVTDAVMADVRVLAAEHGFSGPEIALDNIGDQLVIAPPDAEAMEEALARAMKSVPDNEVEEGLDRMTVHRLRYVLRSGAECDDCEILLVRVGQFKAGG
jgi:glycosyltransferase involved in cell wall biosynthesis